VPTTPMAQVFIPAALRPLTNGLGSIEVPGATVGEVIDNLDRQFPGTKDRLCQHGLIRPGISVAVGGSVSSLGMLQRTEPHSEIHFLPAIGGG
jgi:sulfur-carrier protein